MKAKEKNPYVRGMDAVTVFIARYAKYIGYVIMALLVFEVITRRIFNAPTDWNFFVTKFAYGIYFLLLAPYGMYTGSNIRIDIFYANWSPRTKALIDFIGMILVWIPEDIIVLVYGYAYALNSFNINEMTMSAGFQVVIWPMKALMLVSFVLLLFQSISQLFKLWDRINAKQVVVAEEPAPVAGKEHAV